MWIKKIINRIESDETSWSQILTLYVLAMLARAYVESYSVNYPQTLENLIHYSVAFLYIALVGAFILSALTPTPRLRALKVSIATLGFVVLGPLIDLILFTPGQFQITYFLPQMSGPLLPRLLTFFGPIEPMGVSPGVRFEIALILFLSGYYIRIKSLSWFKAVLGSVVLYLIIFATFALPYFFSALSRLMHIEVPADSEHFTSFYLHTLFVLGLFFFRVRPLLTRLRLKHGVHICSLIAIAALAEQTQTASLPWSKLFILAEALLFLLIAGELILLIPLAVIWVYPLGFEAALATAMIAVAWRYGQLHLKNSTAVFAIGCVPIYLLSKSVTLSQEHALLTSQTGLLILLFSGVVSLMSKRFSEVTYWTLYTILLISVWFLALPSY